MQHNLVTIQADPTNLAELRQQIQQAYENGDNIVIESEGGCGIYNATIDWLETMGAQPYVVSLQGADVTDFSLPEFPEAVPAWQAKLETTSCRAIVFDCDGVVEPECEEIVDGIIAEHCFLNNDPINDAVMLVKYVTIF